MFIYDVSLEVFEALSCNVNSCLYARNYILRSHPFITLFSVSKFVFPCYTKKYIPLISSQQSMNNWNVLPPFMM